MGSEEIHLRLQQAEASRKVIQPDFSQIQIIHFFDPLIGHTHDAEVVAKFLRRVSKSRQVGQYVSLAR